MIKPEPTPDYLIILHPLVSDIPPIIRLRRFLNAALRAYGLRCLDHRIIGDGGNASDFGASACLDVPEVGRQSTDAVA